MRLMLTLGLCGVLAMFLPNQEEQKKPGGIPGFRMDEQARLEKELDGTWLLIEYTNPHETVERRNYSGFAFFQNGYFSFTLRLEVLATHFFGVRPQTMVNAGVHQFRITENRLQTATVLAFTNENETYELEAEPGAFPREFEITLADNQLSLRRHDGLQFVFRRVEDSGPFPKQAADALERYRGRTFTAPEDFGRRR